MMSERRRDSVRTSRRNASTESSRRGDEGSQQWDGLGNQSAMRHFAIQRKADPNAVAAVGPLLVDDAQPELAPGQMTRSQFLATLRDMTTSVANDTLGPLWTATGCPFIDRWFADHANSDAATLESLALRYAGSGASSAMQLIYGITARLRGSIAAWRDGGDMNHEIAEAGLSLGASAPEGEAGGAQAKRAPGGEAPAHGPASLGAGTPLDGGVAGRVGGAFGANLADVRVHSDAAAARSAASQGALAYTIGNHVVFGQGHYQPGTPGGDALLAHELAHVVQQRGGGSAVQQLAVDDDQSSSELEADAAAATAVGALYGDNALASLPLRLHSGGGLRLQRCTSKKDNAPPPAPAKISEMDATQLKAITDAPATHSFSEVAAASARSMMLAHQDSITKTGQGLYMGNHGTPAAPTGVTRSDCTEWTLSVIGSAYKAKGKGEEWKNIKATALANSGADGMKGTELIKAIQATGGWTGVFFGPDPRNPGDKDPEHPTAYKKVREDGTYYGISVDNSKSVVEYRRTDTTKPAKTEQLEKLRKVPFGIMVARGGRHMMLMINGMVYELHWDKSASDADVIQATPLENFAWESGVVLIPSDEVTKAWTP
jgi:hypothetical protein